ncbi:MAG TPA: hypothetical protein VJY63_05445 [Marinospirillum sp.]|uniref:hypothetical protein n=1 Tax=Marinospirillum sp. TaxID=2183934 RepID=UPI002B48DC4B|nr:hypothetical protein [Marinospirillum sp.]HKM15352.1 hypothetical protein [Marinospirillum sp.]
MEDWRKLAAKSERHPEKIPERRKKTGPLLKIISVFGFVSWLLMLPVLVLLEKAKPELQTFFDRWMHLDVQSSWDVTLYRYAFYLMLLVMFLSFFGLVLNALRMRRSTDTWRINLILVFLLSLSGVIYYLLIK